MELKVSSCCGVSLKIGSIVIGVVHSIFAFMCLCLSAAYAEHPHELVEMGDPSIVPDTTALRYILIAFAVASAVQCLFSMLLVFGAETNRPTLLLPWLISNPLGLIIYITGTIITMVHYAGNNMPAFVMGHTLVVTLFSLIITFKVVVVHSYYKHLKSLNF